MQIKNWIIENEITTTTTTTATKQKLKKSPTLWLKIIKFQKNAYFFYIY